MTTPVVVSDERLSNLSNLWLESRYQLGGVRAHGALCVVYDGHDAVLQRLVAIKVSPVELADAYRDALAATAGLSYPAFLAVYDAIEDDGRLFIIQEYIDGRPLTDYLTDGAPTRRAVALALQIARALAYAHQHDLAHGDLTPAAILIDRSAVAHVNNVRLPPDWDYFSAIAASAAASGMAPSAEQTLAMLRSDERQRDIWALGALLWSLVTRAQGEVEQRDASAMRVFREDAPPELRRLIAQALDLTHGSRIASADALALALETLDEALSREATDSHRVTPLAVRAYREARDGAAYHTGHVTGVRRMVSAYGNESALDSPTVPGPTDPITIDTSETRPADDALFASLSAHSYGRARPNQPPAGAATWGDPAGMARGVAYDQGAWAYATPQTSERLMRPWAWSLIGVALFVAFFLIGFLVFPQLKLF